MPAKRTFTDSLLADARERYENTDEVVASIAADLGIEINTLYRNMKKWGWRLRSQRAAWGLSPLAQELATNPERRAAPAGLDADSGEPGERAAAERPEEIAARLERAIEVQIATIERAQASGAAARTAPAADCPGSGTCRARSGDARPRTQGGAKPPRGGRFASR
jgi:hypothetical protein